MWILPFDQLHKYIFNTDRKSIVPVMLISISFANFRSFVLCDFFFFFFLHRSSDPDPVIFRLYIVDVLLLFVFGRSMAAATPHFYTLSDMARLFQKKKI